MIVNNSGQSQPMQTNNDDVYMFDDRKRLEYLLPRLHFDKELTNKDTFYLYGNGLGTTLGDRLVFYIGNPRKKGSPQARTGKKELGQFAQQDAFEAIIALANIAEIGAPAIWQDNLERREQIGEASDDTWPVHLNPDDFSSPVCARIRAMVGDFIEQFGVIHMPSRGKEWLFFDWLKRAQVNFIAEELERFETYKDSIRELLDKRQKWEERRGLAPDEAHRAVQNWWNSELERRGFDSSDEAERLKRCYRSELLPIAKDFSSVSSFERVHGLLQKQEAEHKRKLDSLRFAHRVADGKDAGRIEKSIAEQRAAIDDLAFPDDDLVFAARNASDRFAAEKKESLKTHGLYVVNEWDYYSSALLIHEALEMLLAIHGDEASFKRILPRFHMEVFEDEDGELDAVYTLWYESAGHDVDNVGTEHRPYEYKREGAVETILTRQGADFDNDKYGFGKRVYCRCRPTDSISQFTKIVFEHLPDVLTALIDECVNCNYKGRFARAYTVDHKTRLYKVNDVDHDLLATLWETLRLINSGVIPFDAGKDLSRCAVCGKWILRKREQAESRKKTTCGDACRQKLARENRKIQSGDLPPDYISADLKTHDEYCAYMESGYAIHIGMPSHFKQEDQPAEEPVSQGVLERLRGRLLGS